MFFIFLVYVAALTLESLGSYISVVGLVAKTGPILILLAITLDFAKIVIASVLYKQWKAIHFLLKLVLLPVLIILITVTSTGTYAYIMKEFGKTTEASENQKVYISTLQTEQEKLELRKKEIDAQVSNLPANMVTARKNLTNLFAKEYTQITDRLTELNTAIPNAKTQLIKLNENNGTLGSLASGYDVSPEVVTKIVALLIVFMVDPLAIVLLTVANFLVEQRKKKKNELSPNPPNTPLSKLKKEIFNNKTKTEITATSIITPYIDESGHLFKETAYLKVLPIIDKIDIFEKPSKKINFQYSYLNSTKFLSDYIEQEPLLTKTITHLTPKSLIKEVIEFKPILLTKEKNVVLAVVNSLNEKKLPQSVKKDIAHLNSLDIISNIKIKEDINLSKNNLTTILSAKEIITHKKLDSLTKERTILSPNNIFTSVSVKDEKIVPIIKKQILSPESFLENSNQVKVVNAPENFIINEIEDSVNFSSDKKEAIQKVDKLTLDVMKKYISTDENSFTEKLAIIKYLPYIEDNYYEDDDDENFWNDDYPFTEENLKTIDINITKGFNLQKQLEENQF